MGEIHREGSPYTLPVEQDHRSNSLYTLHCAKVNFYTDIAEYILLTVLLLPSIISCGLLFRGKQNVFEPDVIIGCIVPTKCDQKSRTPHFRAACCR